MGAGIGRLHHRRGGRVAALLVVLALSAPAAVASTARAAAPTVVSGKPTELTQTSVRLNGTVNPNGSPTRYHFVFSGGARISHDAGAGVTPIAVSSVVTGLLPGSTYTFQLVANGQDADEVRSDLGTFQTPKPPCRVPRLKGLILFDASQRLYAAKCQLGKVRYRHLGHGIQRFLNKLKARVVSQSPRAGRKVRAGTKVNLVLAP